MEKEPLVMNFKYVDDCRKCKGTGVLNDNTVCTICEGMCKVDVDKTVTIKVTPYQSKDDEL